MPADKFLFYPNTEYAVTVQWETEEAYPKILLLRDFLEKYPFDGYIESVPTFTTLTIYFDPLLLFRNITHNDRLQWLREYLEMGCERSVASGKTVPGRLVEVPVCYGGYLGPDLKWACEKTQLGEETFVELHGAAVYQVYMLGFVPGFPYMGFVPELIQLPRLQQARSKVAAGSIGIAGRQTGIYPSAIPGGWPLIGRTPVRIYRPETDIPFLIKAGDRVRFRPISHEEFLDTNEYL